MQKHSTTWSTMRPAFSGSAGRVRTYVICSPRRVLIIGPPFRHNLNLSLSPFCVPNFVDAMRQFERRRKS